MKNAVNHTSKDAASAQSILIVDDDPSMRMILSFSLKLFGYVVLGAGNGDEALTIARKHPEIRLIVLDVVMGGLSGKELAQQLKAVLPKAAVLFCSGHPASAMVRYATSMLARATSCRNLASRSSFNERSKSYSRLVRFSTSYRWAFSPASCSISFS